jgi:hypothetical protein
MLRNSAVGGSIATVAPVAATDLAPGIGVKPQSPVQSRVRVVVRVRPQLREDEAVWRELVGASRGISYCSCVDVNSEDTLTTKRIEFGEERIWRFDHVLSCDAIQDEAYSVIARNATFDVVAGYAHTILAYGQTGSGKSHTIFGPECFWGQFDGNSGLSALKPSRSSNDSAGGMVGRAVDQMFRFVAAADAGDCFRVLVSFFEIYNENVHDLLGDSTKSLNVRENKESGVFVESLRRVAATSSKELLSVIAEGVSKRTLCSTTMNRSSSRSHAFLVITFDHMPRSRDANAAHPSPTITRGVLTIVDLAGSERVAKSGSVGSTLAEAKSINKSLSTLGMCIAALSMQRSGSATRASPHVPLRDSKLTRLLTDTLEGRTRTTLVVTISPMAHNFEETKSSLQLAQRAMGLQSSSSINCAPRDAADAGDPKLIHRIHELEQENQMLRRQLQLLLEREVPGKFVDAAVQHSSSGDADECSSIAIHAPVMHIADQREAAMVSKLGAVIQHLQQEIARSTIGAANSSYSQERSDLNTF